MASAAPGAVVRRATAPPVTTRGGDWPELLAPRLLAPPARWGWQTVAVPEAQIPEAAPPAPQPVWAEPPPPDTSALRAARSKAVSRLVRRIAFAVLVFFGFATYGLVIEDVAGEMYGIVVLVALALLAISLIRAIAAVRYASRNIQRFEQPYQAFRAAEQQRHQQALAQWEQAARLHAMQAAEAARAAQRLASGPQWYPVAPVSEPTRVDVFGGDPYRHGWASLLVTLGTSVLPRGERITVLDFTGQDVGGGLLQVARAGGWRTRQIGLDLGSDLDLLGGVASRDLAECLAWSVIGRADATDRQERALVTDVLRRVIDSLDGAATFGRLAAGVQVLRRGTGDDRLSADEVTRLVDAHIGDIDQNEWTSRQLRFLGSQLDVLNDVAPGTGQPRPLWTDDAMSLIANEGGRDDRKELLDRLLVQLARQAMDTRTLGGYVIVAGGDPLGAGPLQLLSEQARLAGVRLILLLDQPQGDLERTVGTGGAVCLMKMYNHRDANLAAELIGRGHRFVLNQATWQVGKSFTDGGGDSFGANTSQGTGSKQRRSGMPGRGQSLNDSRGHAWTGNRSWSTADNISTSNSSSRVYEFIVEPQELLGMPETAFILVDSSGRGRRVLMADANPGICLLDRVSRTPLPGAASARPTYGPEVIS
ncbi:MAG: hypothetical protein ACRDTM_03850 [Micromonosporaceae bacterium]